MMRSKTKYLYSILVLAIIGIIFISGCIQQEVICNPPYIKVGTSCCLDQNNNSICDKDETIATQTQQTASTTTSTSNTSGTSTTETNGTTEASGTTSGTTTTGASTSETNNNVSSSGTSTTETNGTTEASDTTSGTTESKEKSKEKFSVIVSKVIDGDTIKLQTGETVRLLGINTPEKGQLYYKEATNRLKELIEGKEVTLEKDVEDKDQYGRLLRFIFLNGENVNIRLVKEGLATVYIISPNVKYKSELKDAENEAKSLKINLWKPPEQEGKKVCDNRCIEISYFHWNAAGNDCYNLNDEYVVFKNSCPYSCNLRWWTVKDESSRDPYVFPTFILESEANVTLYTGCGTNTNTQLYWCSGGYSCNAIWNNKGGDTLYLRNSNGELVLTYSY